jgi:ABC-type transporter Mla maintaining outer membrane lipid asymmetry ATPase subunit MlaF
VCSGLSIESITEDQFVLSSRAGISLQESTLLPDFEREAYVGLVMRDMKQKAESAKDNLAIAKMNVK